MSTRLYELRFYTRGGSWFLGDMASISGQRVFGQQFLKGEPIDVGELTIPIYEPGRALDITLVADEFVVTERIGRLIGELAPGDVQRIPARIESMPGRYEALNLLSRIDCIDWERTHAYARVNDRAKTGTLASLAPFLTREPEINLYYHVMPDDMRLKTAGIEGPRIFRVKDWALWPVVTEEIKTALEEEGATGLAYRMVS